MEIIELKKMLLEESKHAGYQILSKRLSEIISDNEIKVKSRYEFERLAYILKNIDVNNKKVLDIGGNTGFFTFELLDNGAEKVHYYDGNITHARFVDGASKILNLENKIQITNTYYTFENRTDERYDLALLLNVLHHIGDDYGDKKISINKAKKDIIKQLNFLAEVAKIIVFQLGFNWKGNRKLNLFENGTKREMVNFIQEGIKDHWEIFKIGIAECRNNSIGYHDLNKENISRWDYLGEFLNRPILIMKSIKYNG